MNILNDRLGQLRLIAWIEGISFLLLLFVAMPMKYLADRPSMVRILGMAHGLLFVLFILCAIQAKIERGWRAGRFLRVLLTAFLPFGMVVFDRVLHTAEEGS